MKLLSLATAALLPLTALAAKKPTSDFFQTYNAKQLSASSSFKLDDKTYAQLTKAPRDYSVAVLLTALEARFGCGLCNDFQPEYDLLARSWSKGDKAGEGRLLFGTLDFLDGKATFQSVCCLEMDKNILQRLT
jgi:oligosaccharyltransferase complex subunit gamma